MKHLNTRGLFRTHISQPLLVLATGLMILLNMGLITAGAAASPETALPLAAGMCVTKAQTLIQQGQLEAAITVLEKFRDKQKEVDASTAAKKGYSHYYIDFLLGNTLLMGSESNTKQHKTWLNKAIKAYEQAVKKKPELAPAWLNLAKCRYDLGRMKDAADAFIKGYDTSDTKNADHLYYAAICYFQSHENTRALKIFERLIQQHPNAFSLERRETFVSILFAIDKNTTALPHVEILAKKFTGKKKKKWQEILLYQYLQLKMEKKALAYGKMLTRTDPTEPRWWKAVSHLYLNRNDLKNGLSHLVIYSYLTPTSSEEQRLMADLYLSMGIPSQASKIYETILSKDENFKIIKRMIHACTAAHEPDKAIVWIDRGLALKSDFELLTRKAALLYEMKQYNKAAEVYEQIIKKTKKPGEYLLLLGYCAWNLDQPNRAKTAFEQASKFKKQKKSAHQALKLLKEKK